MNRQRLLTRARPSRLLASVAVVVAISGMILILTLPKPVLSATPLLRPTPSVPTFTPTPTNTPSPAPPGPARVPFATPVGGQGVGSSGGVFACAQWTITIPAGAVPDGGTLHCGGFNPTVAPPVPGGFQLLRRTININLYNERGSWITSFNPPLTLCLTYTDAHLVTAGGTPNNLIIQTAPISGAWSALATTINPTTRQACASVNHLTLFDLSVRAPVRPSSAYSTYTVRPGDTLFRIALRFKTTVAALQAANELTSNTIYPGQVLIISSSAVSVSPLPANLTPRTDPMTLGRYIVQPGDTLFRIALNFGTTVRTLRAINGLKSTYIWAGQELIIPGVTTVSQPVLTPIPNALRAYVVQPGDNLFRIALNHGTTVAALMRANGLTTTRIYAGQRLIIPGP
ncbi:MAG TPA: LysM peptidoglycan-binding domain-containing protein [Anaerolineales bacterium]|nr:LysM peptidoglycan-binding domain-containing protein [Anaerolineales bacterium]